MVVWIKYNRKDKLPEAIADSEEELSRLTGMSIDTIRSSISHKIQTVQKVEIDYEE